MRLARYGEAALTLSKLAKSPNIVFLGYVVSNMSKLKKPSLIAPTPEVFVKSALNRLGIESRTCGEKSRKEFLE